MAADHQASKRPRWSRKIADEALPFVVLSLVRRGVITNSHLESPVSLTRVVRRRLRSTVRRLPYVVGLQEGFVESAADAWKQEKKEVAIVLLATALEHTLNHALRIVIEAKGYKAATASEMIRANNLEPKLTWVFEMFAGRSIPKRLANRARTIFDIRNQIVHYKAEWGPFDGNADSYSKIQAKIDKLGRFRLVALFRQFDRFCSETTHRCDPSLALANKVCAKLGELG